MQLLGNHLTVISQMSAYESLFSLFYPIFFLDSKSFGKSYFTHKSKGYSNGESKVETHMLEEKLDIKF